MSRFSRNEESQIHHGGTEARRLWSFATLLILGWTSILGCSPTVTAPNEAELNDIAAAARDASEAEAEAKKAVTIKPNEVQPAKPKNDPLKDVAPPGPVVPYFNPLTEAEIGEGWISLFDGHSLFGWEPNNKEVNWAVAEGTITADSGPIGLLLTYTPFADYQFRCDYKMAAGGNSGVFLRTLADPKDVQKDCYEVNIVDEHPSGFLTGAIVGLQKTAEPITGSGDWHTFLLTASGTKITVAIDGKEVCTYDDTRPEARKLGLIGLQKNAGKIEFKNIALKPLNQKPLFNGTDLTGWRTVPGSKGEFTVEDGTIHVKGGEGFLESASQHKDFVLQAQTRTNAAAVNTGIFFRAEAGTEKAKSNGYEMQVDHTELEPDKHDGKDLEIPEIPILPPESESKLEEATSQKAITSEVAETEEDAVAVKSIVQTMMNAAVRRPKNAGTGAIFRRINARRIVSFDNEWATVTLIASGPRISTYVNGYAVVHWEDTRKPDPNPRKGQRLDAGHFSLQGHDPGTDASFRAITISDLP